MVKGDELKELFRPLVGLPPGDIKGAGKDLEVLSHRQIGVQIVLLPAGTNAGFDGAKLDYSVSVKYPEAATAEWRETVTHANGCCFSSSVGPKYAKTLSLAHVKGNPIDGHKIAESFAQIASLNHGLHVRPLCLLLSEISMGGVLSRCEARLKLILSRTLFSTGRQPGPATKKVRS